MQQQMKSMYKPQTSQVKIRYQLAHAPHRTSWDPGVESGMFLLGDFISWRSSLAPPRSAPSRAACFRRCRLACSVPLLLARCSFLICTVV